MAGQVMHMDAFEHDPDLLWRSVWELTHRFWPADFLAALVTCGT